jgi:hypothetical protein
MKRAAVYDDREEQRRRSVVRWLEFQLSGREACVEATLYCALIELCSY